MSENGKLRHEFGMTEGKIREPVEQIVARHIVETRFEHLSADAIRATKEHILHTTATVLAGSAAPGCAEFVGLLSDWGGKPESTVFGWGLRVPAHHAAMANSLMGHAQEFDNNDDRIAYKSSVCAIPIRRMAAGRESARCIQASAWKGQG